MFCPPSLAHFFPGTSLSVSFRHRAVIGASIALVLSGAFWCLARLSRLVGEHCNPTLERAYCQRQQHGQRTNSGGERTHGGHGAVVGRDRVWRRYIPKGRLAVKTAGCGQHQRRVPGAGWYPDVAAAATCLTERLNGSCCSQNGPTNSCPLFALLGRPIPFLLCSTSPF
ncbi:hypothetical protein B0T20DRAFT_169175 [Sordaria brevicollis]|uniref:Uncharacterized protein n=1 Tax=Sordaria brevicollis TaxID=83679 RepID=A0AAE0UDH7_SORBR|nr:hypothetical protein B0T20DRAFT_169175 [Sordaria brevicollis]